MHPQSNNIGAYFTSKLALDPTNFGAGYGNISQQNGNSFDRDGTRPQLHSGKYQFGVKYTLASGHTASFVYGMQDSADDSTFADIAGASGVTSLTALNAGTAQRAVMELDVDLTGVRRYVRPRLTPVMSHSGTDVISLAGVLALGGGSDVPPVLGTVTP